MPKLSSDTVTILDGSVRLTKRPNSSAWQAAFKVSDLRVRRTTGCANLGEAKKAARDLYFDYQACARNNLPVVTRRFADVAKSCIAEMQRQLDSGVGKKSFKDYISVLQRYFIPYFGNKHISSIDYADMKDFARWREKEMGKAPVASTLNNHNSAINRVFNEAIAHGYVHQTQVPPIINDGKRQNNRRPYFTHDEYQKLYRSFPKWINNGRKGKSTDMRYLLRDYILILANTGIRHGTEAQNLKWHDVNLFYEGNDKFLEMSIDGKTGKRNIICRYNTPKYLKRIYERSHDISHLSFQELLESKIDKPVFRLPDGEVTKNLDQTFRQLLTEIGLLYCTRDKMNRTLYSLRHTYATYSLLKDGLDIHTLAVQMGTSISMIEKHYSHLSPRLKKEILTGIQYDAKNIDHRKIVSAKSTPLQDDEINRPSIEDDAPDEELPIGPEPVQTDEIRVSGSDDGNAREDASNDSMPSKAGDDGDSQAMQMGPTHRKVSPTEKAFSLFEKGRISENNLLGVIGVDRPNYIPNDEVIATALTLVEMELLTDSALTKIVSIGTSQTGTADPKD